MRWTTCANGVAVFAVLASGMFGQPGDDAKPIIIDERSPNMKKDVPSRQWLMAFSPDGKWLATSAGWNGQKADALIESGEIRVWDVATRKTQVRRRQDWGIRSIAFSRDSKLLAMGDFEGKHQFIDPATGKVVARLPDHDGPLNSILFLPDKKTYVSSSFDGVIKFWDIATQRLVDTLETPGEFVNCIGVSRDGKVFAAGTRQGQLHVWTLADRKRLHATKVTNSILEVLDFSPDGQWIATGAYTKTDQLSLLNATSGQEIRKFIGHGDLLNIVTFTPDGKTLASIDFAGHIMLWDPLTGKQLSTWQPYRTRGYGLSFSPDGNLLATTSAFGGPKLWDVKTLKVSADLPD